jgi:hypothetical protein
MSSQRHNNNEAFPPEDPQAEFDNPGHSQTFPDISNSSQTFWEATHTFDLSDAQFRAIDLTVQGLRDTQIAQALSLNPKTLWRWKTENDTYRRALIIAREQVHGSTTDRCQHIAQKATGVLAGFLEPANEPQNRMKAAQILLNVATRFKPIPEKRERIPTQKEIDNYYFPAPILEPKVG